MLVFGGVPKPIVHIQRPPSIVVPGAQLLRGEVYEILKLFFNSKRIYEIFVFLIQETYKIPICV